MDKLIPRFNIEQLNENEEIVKEVFFTNKKLNSLKEILNKPYRSNYYGIGLCISGKATLIANLEKYEIEKNTIISMSPHVIKQWAYASEDYQTLSVFFTKSYISKYFSNQNYIDQFGFFEQNTKHVNTFTENEVKVLDETLHKIQQINNQQHNFYNEILSNYIKILLFEYQNIFGKLNFKSSFQKTRSQQIADNFKSLVYDNFHKERTVKFYADKLFVTTKYLTETIKSETGKTSNEWIDEILLLEAKILLSNPTLQIAQIAETLNFPDASTFGKFFKNLSGTSPLNYRQSL